MKRQLHRSLLLVASLFVTSACAASYERDMQKSVSQSSFFVETSNSEPRAKVAISMLEKGIGGYVAYAMAHNPRLHAAFLSWQASVYQISKARRLPEPNVKFGYFLQSVETRTGPQNARFSLQQSFPWPTKLIAGADAASKKARALQRQFDAQALEVKENVHGAFWHLWQIRKSRIIHKEHLEVLRSISTTVGARLASGRASLADRQQIDLTAAKLEDDIRSLDEQEHTASASLQAILSVPSTTPMLTPGEPPRAELPQQKMVTLVEDVVQHPLIQSLAHLADAGDAAARASGADRWFRTTVGADWIVIGEGQITSPQQGQDAIAIGAGLSIPLWQSSYSQSIMAHKAAANAQRAMQRGKTDTLKAQLVTAFSAVRDSTRRVRLYRHTLVPQADSAYASVLGAYTSGRAGVAQILLAQRDLLQLRVKLIKVRAEYAQSWAMLEKTVGHPLKPQGKTP